MAYEATEPLFARQQQHADETEAGPGRSCYETICDAAFVSLDRVGPWKITLLGSSPC